MSTLQERKDRAAQLPWVKRLPPDSAIPCQAVTTRHNKACARRAEFHFKRHKDSEFFIKSGDYCYTHLLYQGIVADMREEERTLAWFRR